MNDRIFTGPLPILGDPRQGEPTPGPSPLFLLSDSQVLFWSDGDGHFIDRIAAYTGPGAPRAAYVGASNGDHPDFYSIFLAAMEGIGPWECRMIPADPSSEDLEFVARAEVILLAGGDVERGWRAFERSGMKEMVRRRYLDGGVVIGVSAGAVQLGLAGWPEGRPEEAFETWGLAPFIVDAHDEMRGWAELREVVRLRDDGARGLGIPRGGAIVYHPDQTVEAVRHPACEISVHEGQVVQAMLFPPAEAER